MRHNRRKKQRYSVEASQQARQSSPYQARDEASSSFGSTTSGNVVAPELPGFYYDPEKKRYFRIQANNFGQMHIPTNESITRHKEIAELEKEIRKQVAQRDKSTLQYLFHAETFGSKNSNAHNELTIKHSSSSLVHDFNDNSNRRLTRMNVMQVGARIIWLPEFFTNQTGYQLHFFDITNKLTANDGRNHKRAEELEQTNRVSAHPVEIDAHLDNYLLKVSELPMIWNGRDRMGLFNWQSKTLNFFKFRISSDESNDLCRFSYEPDLFARSSDATPLCWATSPDDCKLVIGLNNSIRLSALNAIDSGRTVLDTKGNECILVEFQKQPPYLLMAGRFLIFTRKTKQFKSINIKYYS